MRIDRTGCTRIVFLTKRYAFKIPNFLDDFRLFLNGLLANEQERAFSRAGWPELCPVLWSIPFGLLVVMPRVRLLTDDEFSDMNFERFCNKAEYRVPAESKANSFGWLAGQIVAIDYGN